MSDPDGRSPGGSRRTRKAPARGLFDRWLRRGEAEPEAVEPSVAVGEPDVDIVDQAEAFQSLRVADVMTPRADVSALEIGCTLAEVVRTFVAVEHSRMPIYRETLDDPVGVVHIRDLMKLMAPPPESPPGEGAPGADPQDPPIPPWNEPVLRRLQREVLYVPASMRAADLLLRMQAQRIHMALVIDEFGGTDGLVTLEDLVEAVVGDISDEHDLDLEPDITERPGGVLEVDARVPLEDLEARLGVSLEPEDEDEEIDTVGGLVATLAGRLPERGEVIVHPGGWEFEVMEADPRRVRRLRLRPSPARDASNAPALADTGLADTAPGEAPSASHGFP